MDAIQRTALHAKGQADLVEEIDGQRRIPDIRLRGRLATAVELPCRGCVEPVQYDVKSDFDLLYRPINADSHPDEAAISEAETEIVFIKAMASSWKMC